MIKVVQVEFKRRRDGRKRPSRKVDGSFKAALRKQVARARWAAENNMVGGCCKRPRPSRY